MDIISYKMGQKSAGGGSTPTPTNVVPAEITVDDIKGTIENTGEEIKTAIENQNNDEKTSLDMTIGNAVLEVYDPTGEDEERSARLTLGGSEGYIGLNAVNEAGSNAHISISTTSGDYYGELDVTPSEVVMYSEDSDSDVHASVTVQNTGDVVLEADNRVLCYAEPTENSSVATKKYVDDNAGGGYFGDYLLMKMPSGTNRFDMKTNNFSNADFQAIGAFFTECLTKGKKPAFNIADHCIAFGSGLITSSGSYCTFKGCYITGDELGNGTSRNVLNYATSMSFRINYVVSNDVVSISAMYDYGNKTQFLALGGTAEYTPTTDYSPATKKYVDDNAGGTPVYRLSAGDIDVLGMKKGVYVIDKINRSNANVNLYYSPNREGNYTFGTSLAFGSIYIFADVVSGMTAGTPIGMYATYTNNKLYLYTLKIRSDSSGIEVESLQVAEIPDKSYVQGYYRTITGYDATKTQILKNVQGTLTWIDE